MKTQDKIPPRKQIRDARDKKEDIDIDMNPMVDLAFLLLTFFMLTTTLSRPHAMELVMPAQDKQEQEPLLAVKESKALTLVPGPEGTMYYYQGITNAQLVATDFTETGLRAILLEKSVQIPDLMVFIKPHPESNYQSIVSILDELNLSGLNRYAFDKYADFEEQLLENYTNDQ